VVAAPAGAALSPERVLSAALANARAQRSVHYVSTGSSATVAVQMVCDAARDRGIQRITFHKSGKTGHATVLVVAIRRTRQRAVEDVAAHVPDGKLLGAILIG